MNILISLFFAAVVAPAYGGLNVAVFPPTTSGSKAVVKLEIRNGFDEPVQSAKVSLFVLTLDGKALGQESRWIIGGSGQSVPLMPGATNHFNFVVPLHGPVTNTDLKSKLSFSRIVLKSGKAVDPIGSVTVEAGRREE